EGERESDVDDRTDDAPRPQTREAEVDPDRYRAETQEKGWFQSHHLPFPIGTRNRTLEPAAGHEGQSFQDVWRVAPAGRRMTMGPWTAKAPRSSHGFSRNGTARFPRRRPSLR